MQREQFNRLEKGKKRKVS